MSKLLKTLENEDEVRTYTGNNRMEIYEDKILLTIPYIKWTVNSEDSSEITETTTLKKEEIKSYSEIKRSLRNCPNLIKKILAEIANGNEKTIWELVNDELHDIILIN